MIPAMAKRSAVGNAALAPVTIHDVAQAAGCSITAVSWALNGKGALRPATRERVLEASRRLGYVANSAARQLRMKRTDTIGLLFPRTATTLFHNVFYADVTAALLDRLAVDGLHLLICLYDPLDTTHPVPPVIPQHRLDAAVVLGTAPARFIAALHGHGLPLLLLDTGCPGIAADSVTSAGRAGGEAAVAHLAAAGHRRLAMVVGEAEDFNTSERIAGFQAGCRRAGVLNAGILRKQPEDSDGLCAQVLALLAGESPPTGLVAVNDTMAAELVPRLRAAGVAVPERLSVVSFNDDEHARTCKPPLTTLAIDRAGLGRRGGDLLCARLAEPGAPAVTERLPMRLVERASVAAPAAAQARGRRPRS
jgi:LacI family transcriptional regulator